jgi:predicted acyltransferase
MKLRMMVRETKRNLSLDYFRGIVVLLFVFFNLLGTFTKLENIPFVLRHNQTNVLLPVDLIASAFAFIIGASLLFSFRKRFERFNFDVLLAYSKRFILLILLGFLLDGIFYNGPFTFVLRWGVLQSLGVAGLLAMLFLVFDDNRTRVLSAVILTLAYQLAHGDNLAFGNENLLIHGGFAGGLGYGIVAVFGLIAADVIDSKRSKVLLLGAALFCVSFVANISIPFDKWTVSSSYVLISSGIAMLIWCAIEEIEKSIKSRPLEILGKNSLTIWVLQYVLVWYPLAFMPLWGKFSLLESTALSLLIILAFYMIVGKLQEKNLRLSF